MAATQSFSVKLVPRGELVQQAVDVTLNITPAEIAGLEAALDDQYGALGEYERKDVDSSYVDLANGDDIPESVMGSAAAIRDAAKLPTRRFLVVTAYEASTLYNFDDPAVLAGIVDAQILIGQAEPGVYQYDRLANLLIYDGETKLKLSSA